MPTDFIIILIFIIIILDSQIKTLREDRYFLKRDNFSLRNSLREVFYEKEKNGFYEGQNLQNGRDQIYIFEDVKSDIGEKEFVAFRNILKRNSIRRIVLVNLDDLLLKMSNDEEESIIEEIFLLDDNPDNLPIIFYGGSGEDFLDFLFFCEWEDRMDMEWVENPWEIEELREVLKEMSERR